MFKQSKAAFTVVLSFIFLITFTATAANNSSFSDEELLSLSPFNQEVQLIVLKDVLKIMGIDFNTKVKLPTVLVSEEITQDQTEVLYAAKSQGMPGWAFEKGVNIYLLDLNIIIIGEEMKLHNLAHEFAHYVQVKYLGYTRENFSDDYLENQAVHTQNNFRD